MLRRVRANLIGQNDSVPSSFPTHTLTQALSCRLQNTSATCSVNSVYRNTHRKVRISWWLLRMQRERGKRKARTDEPPFCLATLQLCGLHKCLNAAPRNRAHRIGARMPGRPCRTHESVSGEKRTAQDHKNPAHTNVAVLFVYYKITPHTLEAHGTQAPHSLRQFNELFFACVVRIRYIMFFFYNWKHTIYRRRLCGVFFFWPIRRCVCVPKQTERSTSQIVSTKLKRMCLIR